YNTFLGDPGKFEFDLNRYRNATVETVRDTAGRWLDTHNRLLLRFRPETSQREAQAPQLDRSRQPVPGADRTFLAPDVKTARLENGLEVYVVGRGEGPRVAVLPATKPGSAADPPQKAGLARLAYKAMHLGTRTRKALEIEEALGDLGTSIQ